MPNIKKIKMTDGSIYSIFDNGALRLNDQGILVTGDETVDELILAGYVKIIEIDDVPVTEEITNVLTQKENTGEIKKRSTDYLLKDIGGYSADVESDSLVLTLGKKSINTTEE